MSADGLTRDEAEFFGQVLTATMTQTADITERVMDNYEARIIDLENDFAELFDAVDRANHKVDSARIERILDGCAWKRDRIQRKAEES